jgi:hypothetical protein
MLQAGVVACRRPLSLVRFACVNHGIAAILGIFEAISRNFSVLQTVWRRERDSNPRYSFVRLNPGVSADSKVTAENLTEMRRRESRDQSILHSPFHRTQKAKDWRFVAEICQFANPNACRLVRV